jgi:hypothetical protein
MTLAVATLGSLGGVWLVGREGVLVAAIEAF